MNKNNSKQAQAPELKSYSVTLEIEVTAETKMRAMEMVAKALRDAVRDPQQLAQVLMNVQEKNLGTGVEPVPTGEGKNLGTGVEPVPTGEGKNLGTGVEPVPTGLVAEGPPELN